MYEDRPTFCLRVQPIRSIREDGLHPGLGLVRHIHETRRPTWYAHRDALSRPPGSVPDLETQKEMQRLTHDCTQPLIDRDRETLHCGGGPAPVPFER